MNYEKQCPSARNLAFLNHGVSPDRNALAKAAGDDNPLDVPKKLLRLLARL